MVAAVAFACIRSSGVLVRRVEFTPELKACRPFLRFASLGHEPLDTAALLADTVTGDGIEQHLHLAYTAAVCIVLPSLAFLRYASQSGLADPAIYLQAFGICLADPAHWRAGVHSREKPHPAPGRLACIVDHVVRNGELRADANSPFRFVENPFDPSGNRGALEGVEAVKIASKLQVRALLLVEPPSFGTECHLRLYTETDRPRPPAYPRNQVAMSTA